MKKTFATALALSTMLAFPGACLAQWHTKEGHAIPEDEHTKSRDGFSAMLLMTPDPNWLEEWSKPAEYTPKFTTSRRVSLGKELNILTVLSNPKLDAEMLANVECDFSVQQPDGSLSIDEHGLACFKGKLAAESHDLYMTAATLNFISEATDQKGEYKVKVTLHDRNRGTSLVLADAFVNE